MTCRSLLLTLLFFGLSPVVWAYELQDVLSRIQEKENKFQSIQFHFRQEINFATIDEIEVVEGKATFQKPNKLNIQKNKPEQQITISNGKKIWVYNPTFKQVWVGPWKDWLQDGAFPKGMVPMLDYISHLQENFDLSLQTSQEESDEFVVIRAQPKEDHLGFILILTISTESWLPQQTRYESDSAIVITKLFKHAVDPKLPKSLFHFKPPSDVDIIPLN